MKFEKISAKDLDDKLAKKIILKGGCVYYIISLILLLIGIFMLFIDANILSFIFIISSVFLLILSFGKLFLKGEKREKYLTSRLIDDAIKSEIKNGRLLSKDEIYKIKFKYDPIYYDKVMKKIHKDEDNKYKKNVIQCEETVKKLEIARINEINRINSLRWQSVGKGKLKYNLIEGKININESIYLFSDIKSAEINKDDSYRLVTTVTNKSKKHFAVGKSLIGKIFYGNVGGVVGSTMGNTKTSSNSVSDSIPVCNHIGVIVNIDDFKYEISILNKSVDQSSSIYESSLRDANEIVSKLHYLAKQPVPKTFLKVEDEQTVLEIGKSIARAQKDLEMVKEKKPTYEISDKYLSK